MSVLSVGRHRGHFGYHLADIDRLAGRATIAEASRMSWTGRSDTPDASDLAAAGRTDQPRWPVDVSKIIGPRLGPTKGD